MKMILFPLVFSNSDCGSADRLTTLETRRFRSIQKTTL